MYLYAYIYVYKYISISISIYIYIYIEYIYKLCHTCVWPTTAHTRLVYAILCNRLN